MRDAKHLEFDARERKERLNKEQPLVLAQKGLFFIVLERTFKECTRMRDAKHLEFDARERKGR